MKVFAVTALFVVWIGLVVIWPATCSTGMKDAAREYDRCVEKGVAYFASVGMPILSTGQTARQAAQERCSRSPVAFGS